MCVYTMEKSQLIELRNYLLLNKKKDMTGYPSIDKTHLKDTTFFERHPFIPNYLSVVNTLRLLWLFSPNDPAVSCLNISASHKELLQDARIVAGAMKELGIKKKDIIGVSMPNYYQALVSFLAANSIGAILTPLNPLSQDDELVQHLNNYNSPLLINYAKSKADNEWLKKHTNLEHIITLESGSERTRDFNLSSNKSIGYSDFLNFSDLKLVSDYHKGLSCRFTKGSDDAIILFTSGSTGNPKDMLFTNKNLLAAAIYYKNSAHMEMFSEKCNKWMSVVPFMYPYGFVASVLSTLLAGKESLLAPDVGPHNINEYMKRANLIFGSPAFLELIKRNIDPDLDCSALEMFISGGDFLSESQSRGAIELFNKHNADVEICNGSGNGELLGCCTNAMHVPYKPKTVGKLVNGPSFVIIDQDAYKEGIIQEVKYGECGILCVAGEQVFKGYYNNPQLTKESKILFNGKEYYNTGNIGSLDKDGYFTMIGRSSRFFIVNTLNKVYCELVQNVVSAIDVVESCAVVPKPNDEQLFESKAYVVLKQGLEPTEELAQYIMEKSFDPYINSYGNQVSLKDYEVPKSVTFLEAIPKTPGADKIDYERLKKMAENEYEEEKSAQKKMVK